MFPCEILSGFRNLKGPESILNRAIVNTYMKYNIQSNMSTINVSSVRGVEVDYLTPAVVRVDSAKFYEMCFVENKMKSLDFLERSRDVMRRRIHRLSVEHEKAYDNYGFNLSFPSWSSRRKSDLYHLAEKVEALYYRREHWTALCQECEDELMRRESEPEEPSVDPQMFSMDSVFKSLKGHFSGLLDTLGQSFINNHQLVEMVLKAIIVFVFVKYVRRLTIPQVMVLSFLSTLVIKLVSQWMMHLAALHRKRRAYHEFKSAFNSANKQALSVACKKYLDEGAFLAMQYWIDGEWQSDVKRFLLGDSPTVEEPDSDGDDGSDEDCVEPQIALGQAAFVSGAMFFLTKRVPLYRAVVDNDKLQRNLSSMFCGAAGAFENVLNTLLRAFGKKEVVILRAHQKVINDWEHSVRSFVDRIRLGSVSAMTATSQMEYDRFRDQGLNLEHLHKDPQSRAVIKRGMDALQSVSCFFAIRGECTSRMEPLVLCFAGSAGVGKTTLARMISAQLANYMCSPDEIAAVGGDLTKLCFQKGTSEYWEGYCGQPICVMDDWLQAIPETGVENEVVNLIRAANQWPYPLNMASLDMKGKVNFTSRAILMTTNVTNSFYVSKVVSCPAAVARRMDMCYNVTVTAEYRKGGCLDVAKVAAIQARSVSDYDCVWRFSPLDIMEGKPRGEGIPISQLVNRMREEYSRRISAETGTRDFVKNFASLPVEPQIFGLKCVAAVGIGAASFLAVRSIKGVAGAVQGIRSGIDKTRGALKVALPLVGIAGCALAYSTLRQIVKAVVFFVQCAHGIIKNVLGSLGFGRKKPEPQMAGSDPVLDRVRKNMVPVSALYKHGKTPIHVGYALFLTARHLVVPYHFMREVRSKICELRVSDSAGVVVLDNLKVVKEAPMMAGGIRDFCILELPRNFVGMRDIRSHFAPKSVMRNTAPGYMVKPTQTMPVVVGSVQDSRTYSNILTERVALVQHSGYTAKGDCGSVLIVRNQSEVKRLRGIHVAGLDTGFYCPLYAEDMPDYAEHQLFCGLEEVENVDALHNNGTTGIAKTAFSGYLVEPKGGPACLRPSVNVDGVLVDPMLSVVERSKRDFASIALPSNVGLCVDAVISEVFEDIGNEDLGLLTYEQAVAGIEGDDFVKGIARGKSMGYPLCRKYANKRPAFGAEGPYVFDTQAAAEVKKDYDLLVADYMAGRSSAVFRDCLKDEVLKQEKVSNVDTRLISASPVHFTILVRRLFGKFAAQFMRKRLKHGALVGVNVYSPEWGVISHELRSMNKDGVAAAGDYKAFDKSQHPLILKKIIMEIARRLPHYPGMEKLFEGIARDTAEAQHLGGNSYKSWVIYRIIGSLPSGHPLTSILNSLYNLVVFRMCWCDMYGDQAVLSFREKVRCYVYGDDNIFAPSDDCLDFNLEAMARFCPRIGMVYTSEDKTGDLYTLKPVGQCSFLKRRFGLDSDGYVYAPLEFYSIGDMLNWRKKKTTDEEHLAQVSVAMIRELAAYDFGLFEANLIQLRRLFRQVGVRDPTNGIGAEYAYTIARGWYRGYTPVWSIDE